MAKLRLNPVLDPIRGAIGGLVFKVLNGQPIVGRTPDRTGIVPSPAQLATLARFKAAAAYGSEAYRDPVRKQMYVDAAHARGRGNGFALAMRDFLSLPEVTEIDLADYHGHVGDPIRVTATDDFKLVSVKVTLKNALGAVLEQGLATNDGTVWVYHATTVAPVDQNVLIEAEAKDHPGHERALFESWHA